MVAVPTIYCPNCKREFLRLAPGGVLPGVLVRLDA